MSVAVAAPADRRFRRAHVKPARRRLAWRPVWLALRLALAAAAVGYGGWRLAAVALEAEWLQVSHVTVRGHQRLSTGEALALVDGMRGENLLALDLDRWRARLLASPWVEDATLRRILPGRVEVVVRERRPMGIARLGRVLYLVDAQGVIIDEYGPAYADLDLPLIDGLGRAAEGRVDEARARLAARVLTDLAAQPDLAARVSQIEVSDVFDAVVILEDDTARLRLGHTDFARRLQEYVDLAPALRERVADIDYVDLRFGERVYVRPRQAAGKNGPPRR